MLGANSGIHRAGDDDPRRAGEPTGEEGPPDTDPIDRGRAFQLRKFVRRPRSRKQLHRARALLALDEGHPIDTVARMFRVGIDRVEGQVGRFKALGLGFLVEPGRPP